jgi:prolyl-tRNA editing enzyme YbaK/EbsC (Cys-tRNA(Pro) deacylase)
VDEGAHRVLVRELHDGTFHAHTESALAEAESLGVSPDDVAKTLIVKLPEGYLRAVLPSTSTSTK